MVQIPGTEQDSLYPNLSELSTQEVLTAINQEDKKVALAVEHVLPTISKLIDVLVERMKQGGRLFYIGAGTSGRLGILDASECPPTYGVSDDMVIGIIAGGDSAIRKAVEFAEDNPDQAMIDLEAYQVSAKDTVLGISASGNAPYVIGGLKKCKDKGIFTASLTCSLNSPMASVADLAIELPVGPEVITGSTRMKSGTAQKMVLNMISTCTMVKLGKVEGSKMVNMQLSNDKLIDRGTRMIVEKTGIDYEKAKTLLLDFGSVKSVLDSIKKT